MVPHSITTDTYTEIAAQGKKALEIIRDTGIAVNPSSDVLRCVKAAETLANWSENPNDSMPSPDDFYRTVSCRRFSDAVVSVNQFSDRRALIKKLMTGSLRYWDNSPSVAKNTEWEIMMLRRAKTAKLEAWLAEPDVQTVVSGEPLGIACKRVYSASQIDKRISEGVDQIKRSKVPGCVALNLDSLLAPDRELPLLVGETVDAISAKLQKVLSEVTSQRLTRLNKRYFSAQRLCGIIVSVGLFADVKGLDPRLSDCRDTLMFTVESVSERLKARFRNFAVAGGARPFRPPS